MSVVTSFLKQKVSHERYLGMQSGVAKFAPAATIKARYEPRAGKRYTATGTEINAEGYVLAEVELKVSDKIEGKAVRRVEPIVAANGKTIGYEAYL